MSYSLHKFEQTLAGLFATLPALPANAREILVKLTPYFAVVGLVVSIPTIILLAGLSTIPSPLATLGSSALALVFALVNIGLLALSIRGLFARRIIGWRYLYYNALVNALHAILRLDIIGLVIGSGLSLYILFQIRNSYR
jgi:hypothetical protein